MLPGVLLVALLFVCLNLEISCMPLSYLRVATAMHATESCGCDSICLQPIFACPQASKNVQNSGSQLVWLAVIKVMLIAVMMLCLVQISFSNLCCFLHRT